MEDKTFELLTKMYSEYSTQFEEVKSEMQKISNQVVKLENDLKSKAEIALEGYQAVSGKLTTLENKIDNLTSKVESQEVQITVLKGGKKAVK
jgi:predicted  nucleic acid-binding Zn-ribbon protein